MPGTIPDYYDELKIDPKATQAQIRAAYKKQALEHHPDRAKPGDAADREMRTKKFQGINDAYYTLSDPTRRRDYDSARTFNNFSNFNQQQSGTAPDEPASSHTGQQGSPWWEYLKGCAGFGGANANSAENPFSGERGQSYRTQWDSVFEEMMQEEGLAEGENAHPTGKFWSIVGGVSGAGMGFIIANIPGAIAGFMAGGKLGQVRDKHQQSVAEVFQTLPPNERFKLLSQLATRLISSAVSG